VEDENEAERIKAQMPEYVKRHFPEVMVEKGVQLHMQKVDDVHLTSHRELEFKEMETSSMYTCFQP